MKWHWKCHITAFPGFYGRERRSKTKWGLLCPSVQSDGNKIHPGLRSQQRPRPVLLSFITVLCSCDTGEVLPLGAIIFVLLAEQFIEVSFGSHPLGLLQCQRTSSVQKNPLLFTEVASLLRNRNISISGLKSRWSCCGLFVSTVWAEGLKVLHYPNRSVSPMCSYKVTFWCSCWWQGVFVQWSASWRSVGLLQNMNCRIKAKKVNRMTERFGSFNEWVICVFLEKGAGPEVLRNPIDKNQDSIL